MSNFTNDVVCVDVNKFDLETEVFDLFMESIRNSDSPLSATLDALESAADAEWFDTEMSKPVTVANISTRMSSGLPGGDLV